MVRAITAMLWGTSGRKVKIDGLLSPCGINSTWTNFVIQAVLLFILCIKKYLPSSFLILSWSKVVHLFLFFFPLSHMYSDPVRQYDNQGPVSWAISHKVSVQKLFSLKRKGWGLGKWAYQTWCIVGIIRPKYAIILPPPYLLDCLVSLRFA